MKLALAVPLLFACTAAAEPALADAAEPALADAAEPATIRLRITDLRSANGQMLILVYRGEAGFPGDPAKAWRRLTAKIAGSRASVDIPGAPAGEYAISVVHDEDGDGTLDTSWIGIPKEGIGASNNATGRMGPPKYRDAKFTVGAAGADQTISVVYL